MGKGENPALAVAEIIVRLEQSGAEIIGIPCNSMHAPPIFSVIREKLPNSDSKVKLLNMIDEAAQAIDSYDSSIRKVRLLCTIGASYSGVYPELLGLCGLEVVEPDEAGKERVHAVIYDNKYGIKGQSNPVTDQARGVLIEEMAGLLERGAQAGILGCTEIPLAIPETEIDGNTMFDPTTILARALISEAAPEKLKPL